MIQQKTTITTVRACLARIGVAADDIGDDDRLLAGGIIDSLNFSVLLSALEQEAGAPLPSAVMQNIDRFDTIACLATVLDGQHHRVTAASFVRGARESDLYDIVPQMEDADTMPYNWTAYTMLSSPPGFQSRSITIDADGFRQGWDGDHSFDYRAFCAADGPKGIILGNSVAFGVGVSHDRMTLANQLNARRRPGDPLWHNFSLRGSSLTQERLMAELHAPDDLTHVVWCSGVSSLVYAIGIGPDAVNPSPYLRDRLVRQLLNGPPHQPAPDINARLNTMVPTLFRDWEVMSAWLSARRVRFTFLVQPELAWVNKPLSSEEETLVAIYDRQTKGVAAIHQPDTILPLRPPFQRALMDCGKAAKMPVIDTNDLQDLKTAEWLFMDRIHLTDKGHAALADIVVRWLHGA